MEKDTDFEDFIKPKAKSKYPYTSNDPDDRIQIIKNFYEKRLEVLKEDVKLVYQRISSDDLLHTMKEDPTSVEFVNQRVREIFDDVISNDREIILEKVYKQYANLKGEYRKMEEEKKKV
jgi:hypothetical protein